MLTLKRLQTWIMWECASALDAIGLKRSNVTLRIMKRASELEDESDSFWWTDLTTYTLTVWPRDCQWEVCTNMEPVAAGKLETPVDVQSLMRVAELALADDLALWAAKLRGVDAK